jgi:cytochrome c-type biogenesis protein CcmF
MIPELGTFFLILAALFALFLMFSPKSVTYYVIAEGVCIAFAYAALTFCFLTDDFTVRYVLLNSSTSLPWFYKLCAVWGGHEGSMLLWVFILSIWMVALVVFGRALERPVYERVLRVLGVLSLGFLLFLLCTSNPFLRQFEVLNSTGRDLNPLLQDPGFLFHPPMLYMGYVGFSVAFSLAIAALWLGRVESAWAGWARPWTLAAWCCLTAGITLGSWWAYRELGWGGWWFWDPVENASFMPWLAGTALLHSLVVNEKRGYLKAWTVLLAITAFSLSLIGTFLVRSGVLTSVHAFAVDPARGLYILLFLLVVVGGSLGLFAVRVDALKDKEKPYLISREGGLLLNNIFLSVAMLTVLLGTIYPLLIDALNLGKLSVGAPYFNTVFVPLMLPVLAVMGFGVNARFHQDTWQRLGLLLKVAFLLSVLSPILIFVWFKAPIQPLVFLGLALGVWVILSTCKSLKTRLKTSQLKQVGLRFWGMFFAHIGVAITVLGISVSAGFGLEQDIKLMPNEIMQWSGYEVALSDVSDLKGPNYDGTRACFKFLKQKKQFSICPEKRVYHVTHTVMSDAGIRAGFFSDIYIALGEPLQQGAWSLRLMFKPGIRWIWGGGFFILFGGFLALLSAPRIRKTT